MNIGELSSDIKLYLQEKASNPFWTPFIVSWLIWNHRLVAVLLSDAKIQEKFDIIDSTLYPSLDFWSIPHWWLLGKAFFFPLATSLAITLFLPYFLKWLYEKHGKHQNAMKKLQNEIEGKRPISEEEQKELLLRLHKKEGEHRNGILLLTKETEELKGTIQLLTTEKEKHNVSEEETFISQLSHQKVTLQAEIAHLESKFKEIKEIKDIKEINDVKLNNSNSLKQDPFSASDSNGQHKAKTFKIEGLSKEDNQICFNIIREVANSNEEWIEKSVFSEGLDIPLNKFIYLMEKLDTTNYIEMNDNYLHLTHEGRDYLYGNGFL